MTKLWLVLVMASNLYGALIPNKAKLSKTGLYLKSGMVVGGVNSNWSHLLKNITVSPKKGGETITFDIAPNAKEGKPVRPGFFFASLKDAPRKLTVQFQDISELEISTLQILKVLRESQFIDDPQIYHDIARKTVTMEFPLKRKTKAEVYENTKGVDLGQVIVDFINDEN